MLRRNWILLTFWIRFNVMNRSLTLYYERANSGYVTICNTYCIREIYHRAIWLGLGCYQWSLGLKRGKLMRLVSTCVGCNVKIYTLLATLDYCTNWQGTCHWGKVDSFRKVVLIFSWSAGKCPEFILCIWALIALECLLMWLICRKAFYWLILVKTPVQLHLNFSRIFWMTLI